MDAQDSDQPDRNQVDGDDVVEQFRHHEDEDAGKQRDERGKPEMDIQETSFFCDTASMQEASSGRDGNHLDAPEEARRSIVGITAGHGERGLNGRADNKCCTDKHASGARQYRARRTGEPIPQTLLDKAAAARFDQGFDTTGYLSASLLDQAWHQLDVDQVAAAVDVTSFEADALHRVGLDFAPVQPRYRSTCFSHAFAGDYSAGYYAYIWSEVLAADSTDWVLKHGGLTLFRDLTGTAPDIGPLLNKRGLDVSQ